MGRRFIRLAVSALHLSYHEGGEGRWWFELIGHNASVPQVAILYQDYRFAFADIFLKRALGFVLLVGLIFGAYVLGVAPMLNSAEPLTERSILALLAMWVATALMYPRLRRNAERFCRPCHSPEDGLWPIADYDLAVARRLRNPRLDHE